ADCRCRWPGSRLDCLQREQPNARQSDPSGVGSVGSAGRGGAVRRAVPGRRRRAGNGAGRGSAQSAGVAWPRSGGDEAEALRSGDPLHQQGTRAGAQRRERAGVAGRRHGAARRHRARSAEPGQGSAAVRRQELCAGDHAGRRHRAGSGGGAEGDGSDAEAEL
ncbi:MAG: hypothetical protein AVDCRST_MAG31-1361, partial [uncultured Sphingomonas sp.]